MIRRSGTRHRALRLSGLFALLVVLTSCATGRIDPTDPVGENAKQIDGLMPLLSLIHI